MVFVRNQTQFAQSMAHRRLRAGAVQRAAQQPKAQLRQHTAGQMAAVAAADVGRRDGPGRRYMASQATAVAAAGGSIGRQQLGRVCAAVVCAQLSLLPQPRSSLERASCHAPV